MLKINLTALDYWSARHKLQMFCMLCIFVSVCGYALLIANLQLRVSHHRETNSHAATLLQGEERKIKKLKFFPKQNPIQFQSQKITLPPINILQHCKISDFKWQQPRLAEGQGRPIYSLILGLHFEQAICVLNALSEKQALGYLQKMQLAYQNNSTSLSMQLDFLIRDF